ncbi:putative RNA methyltransferase [Solibacillus sp. FSL H8-0538]|uniref:putative RNA methyltransferase n=1 Tax=Solibacillus sp. FSL H8-0538 TaxID=2921400 RepID=UPI0030F8B6DC
MGQLSKRAISIQTMKNNEPLFACPICAQAMTVSEEGKMSCASNHSFDIAKQGYINLMHRPAGSMYSKELFEARQQIIVSGLYDTMQQTIASLIEGEAPVILDTGCGEGSHLQRICTKLENSVGVGIDIAKEGILAAAKFYEGLIWCVGDLANSPYNAQSFDTILNILSPANYEEFKRLLKPGGKVIKVVPQAGYLKELRAQAFADSEKESYSNEQTVERFKESFDRVAVTRITYTMPLEVSLVPKLLEMTPMGWHIENHKAIEISEITIDLNILVGACS